MSKRTIITVINASSHMPVRAMRLPKPKNPSPPKTNLKLIASTQSAPWQSRKPISSKLLNKIREIRHLKTLGKIKEAQEMIRRFFPSIPQKERTSQSGELGNTREGRSPAINPNG